MLINILLLSCVLINFYSDACNSCKDKKSSEQGSSSSSVPPKPPKPISNISGDDGTSTGHVTYTPLVNPIINDHSNGLQDKQISDIKEDYYGDSYKKKPCLSYRDKLDLLFVLKGHEFDQELHSAFIERVVAFLNEGKILRFSKDFKGDYVGYGNWENVIWFFDGSTIQKELGVECNKCKLLKCFNEKIYYFTLFTNQTNLRPPEEFYNFTDFIEANCDKYINEWGICKEDRNKFLNLQFDISPEALFK